MYGFFLHFAASCLALKQNDERGDGYEKKAPHKSQMAFLTFTSFTGWLCKIQYKGFRADEGLLQFQSRWRIKALAPAKKCFEYDDEKIVYRILKK